LLQARLEDVVGLVLAELEARDQRGARLVLGADDADDFIQVEEGHQQAFQQVQAALDAFEAVLQAPRHRLVAELEPFGQQHAQVLHLRAAVLADHVEVDAIAALDVRRGEQVAPSAVRRPRGCCAGPARRAPGSRGRTRRGCPSSHGSFFARICAAICSITFDGETW
jgi:hypothetical protein